MAAAVRSSVFIALALAAGSMTAARAQAPEFISRPGSKAPFSTAVRAGDFIFASGQIGASQDGKIPADMKDQARLAMDNVGNALSQAGAGFDDVVKCTVMLSDMTKWADFNSVYVTYFKPGHLPARSAFGATALALGAGVEVECLAYKPQARPLQPSRPR